MQGFSFTVPENKIWVIRGFSNVDARIFINGVSTLRVLGDDGGVVVPAGSIISDAYSDGYYLNIYEYPISGSGTEQGMDYIEP